MKKKSIAIVGGGIGGLSLAYFLSKDNRFEITLFEKNASLGGLLGLLDIDGVGFEGFYHHLFTSHNHAIDLIDELGLHEKLMYLPSKMGLYYNKRVYPFTTPVDLLTFSPLSIINRVRCGLVTLYLQKFITWRNWQQYRTVPAAHWLRKFSGDSAYEVIWKPLLVGKFGDDAETISLAWLWHRLYSRSSSRTAGSMKEVLVYLDGGFKILVDTLAKTIRQHGAHIRVQTSIDAIEKKGAGIQLLVGGKKEMFDYAVVTAPVPIASKLINGLPDDYVQKLNRIRYRAAICIVATMKKSLLPDQIYWLNINDRRLPFLAVVEHTHFVDPSQYGGEHIIYIGSYPGQDDPLLSYSPEKLMKVVTDELHVLNPDFTRDWITKYWIFKDRFAQPIVDTRYHTYIPSYEMPINNLYLITMAQIYPHDRSTDQAVAEAQKMADLIRQRLL